MWTVEQIELIGGGYAPQASWYRCEHCKMEYQKQHLAWGCWKSHFRIYEQKFDTINPKTVKHEVSFDGDRPLCRSCTRSAEGELLRVQMEHPPACSRCNKLIQDPPRVELTPPIRPPSEVFREMRLSVSREGQEVIARYQMHKKLSKTGFTTGHTKVDEANFKDFGPTKRDGNGGLVRSEKGYVRLIDNGPRPCKWPT